MTQPPAPASNISLLEYHIYRNRKYSKNDRFILSFFSCLLNLDPCGSGRTLSCQALEGADRCDSATGQCMCGIYPACSPTSTMPVCYNPGKTTAICGCRIPLNNEPTSCTEPNPTCNSVTATCQVILLLVHKRLLIMK